MADMSYTTALWIDLSTLFVCACIARVCTRSLLHPAAVMLGAHAYIVTLRLSQLARGYFPMSYSFTWPIGSSEIVRASLASDLALVAMAMAWLTVRFWGWRQPHQNPTPRILLSESRICLFAAGAILLAIMCIAILGPHPQRDVTGDYSSSTSGFLLAPVSWAGWCFCLLQYYYGFRWYFMALTSVTLITFMLLSTFRGAIIIPCVFMLFTWLLRRGDRKFPLALIPAVLCLWVVWLPMKPTVYAIQSGRPITEALEVGCETAFGNLGQDSGSGIDFQFLDMVASSMTLVDVHGSFFYGSTLSPLLVSPFPRQLWSGKPELNQYQKDLDIPSRAMAKLHMTAGLIGESYANFGYFGVVMMPFIVSLSFSYAYRRLSATTILSPGCMLYLLYLGTYMQLYRDGLISAVWFPFVHCAPVGWGAVTHWLFPPQPGRAVSRATVPTGLSVPEIA